MELEYVLLSSQSSAATGNTLASWRALNDYARHLWLEPSDAAPRRLITEFFTIRGAAAELLGMEDEATECFRSLRRHAQATGDQPTALIATANLAYQAMNREHPPINYPPETPDTPEELLQHLAAEFRVWNPATTPRAAARALTTAATTAYTVAVNCVPDMAEEFAEVVRAFSSEMPDEYERKLWFAQYDWFAGREDSARQQAHSVLHNAKNPTTRFDAADMLGHFALLEDQEEELLRYWRECADLACVLECPLVGIKHAELAARVYMHQQHYADALALTRRMLVSVEGIPMSPALLRLQDAKAETCYMLGDYHSAWNNALAVAHWSETLPDRDFTLKNYAVAESAGKELGLGKELDTVMARQAELLEELE